MGPDIGDIIDPRLIRPTGIELLLKYVWINQLIVIGVSGDFKAFVTTAFDAMFFFDTSDHVQTNVMALLS